MESYINFHEHFLWTLFILMSQEEYVRSVLTPFTIKPCITWIKKIGLIKTKLLLHCTHLQINLIFFKTSSYRRCYRCHSTYLHARIRSGTSIRSWYRNSLCCLLLYRKLRSHLRNWISKLSFTTRKSLQSTNQQGMENTVTNTNIFIPKNV